MVASIGREYVSGLVFVISLSQAKETLGHNGKPQRRVITLTDSAGENVLQIERVGK